MADDCKLRDANVPFTWPLVGFWGWIPSTPVIPKLYWDVYSDEQRTKDMCCQIQNLIDYTGVTDAALNDMHADVVKIDGIAADAVAKAEQAVATAENAEQIASDAVTTAGNAVTIATRAEGKIDTAVTQANNTLSLAETALDMANEASDYAKQKADEFAPYTAVAEPLYITNDTLRVRAASRWNAGVVQPGEGLTIADDGTIGLEG